MQIYKKVKFIYSDFLLILSITHCQKQRQYTSPLKEKHRTIDIVPCYNKIKIYVMDLYIILIIIGSILFISSICLWFRSGVIRRRNKNESRKDDKIGGYMFMSSIFIFILALIFWFIL